MCNTSQCAFPSSRPYPSLSLLLYCWLMSRMIYGFGARLVPSPLSLRYARKHGYELVFYKLQGEGCKNYVCGAGCSHERYGPRHPSYCKVGHAEDAATPWPIGISMAEHAFSAHVLARLAQVAGLGDALSSKHDWIVFLDSDAFMVRLLAHLWIAGGGSRQPAFFGAITSRCAPEVFYPLPVAQANATLSLPHLIASFGGILDSKPMQAYASTSVSGVPTTAAEGFFGWDWPYTLGPNMGFIALRNTPNMRELVRDW